MKTLTLVRHAKSSWHHPELKDFDRPLKKRGERDAPKMGAYLASQKVSPNVIVSSPAKRTWLTAEAIASELKYDLAAIQADESIYEAGVYDLLRLIGDVDASVEHLMLVGHNPGVTHLCNYLSDSPSQIENIPTCGIATLQFKTDSWFRLRESSGKITMLVFPKNFDH